MMDLVYDAAMFAIAAHAKQRRKYTDDAYIVHPMAVATMLADLGEYENVVAAAWLHDTVEDCGVLIDTVERRFGAPVAGIVFDMTHVFTKEAFPTLNRAQRKARELDRIATTTPDAKTVKVADLIDNTKSIVAHDPEFAVTYLAEARSMLDKALRSARRDLWQIASDQVNAALSALPAPKEPAS